VLPATAPIFASTEGDLGIALAAVVVLGVGAQLLGSRIKVPSILLLLAGGVLAGPVLHIVEPEELLGDLRFPIVSLAVGVLLFEGGLNLRVAELREHGPAPIIRLVTIGVLVTWFLGSIGAAVFVGLDRNSALLLGSILVVSGPTVVLPLLRFVRVRDPVHSILRWEGIFIDPIGATLAIVVLDAVVADEAAASGIQRVFTTAGAGTAAGLLGAAVLVLLLSRHWVPDNLHNAFTLAVVVAAFAGANVVRPEAGLFATTVLGVALANQDRAPMGHIRGFEEDLGQLILGGLFIVLAASIDLDAVVDHLPGALALSALLIFVARPAAVYLSTAGTRLRWSERAYLMCVSPRGIVAATVSALFALELEEFGEPVEALVPVTYTVIVVTVVFSAIAARLGADRFRVGRPPARGVAIVGGPDWALELASWLAERDVPTLIVTNDPLEEREAITRGLLSYTGRLDSEDLELALDSVGIDKVLAVSRLPVLNSMAIARAVESVGRANVYHLPTEDEHGHSGAHLAVIARRPFDPGATQEIVEKRHLNGARIEGFDPHSFRPDLVEGAIALLEIDVDGVPHILASTPAGGPEPGAVRAYLRDALA
jgi:NhaP-type Na+/H+ or K+/H+ antiporter